MALPMFLLSLAVLDVTISWVLSGALGQWGMGPLLQLWLWGVMRLAVLSVCLRPLVHLKGSWLDEPWPAMATCCLLLPTYNSLALAVGSTHTELLHAPLTTRLLLTYLATALGLVVAHRFLPQTEAQTPGQTPATASVSRLLSCLRPDLRRFLLVAVFVVLSSAGEMAVPYYSGRLTDRVTSGKGVTAFTSTILTMAAFSIGSAVMEFICDLTYNTTMTGIHTRIQGSVFRSVLRQDIKFFSSPLPGEITSRVTTDTNTMSESLTEQLSLLMWYLTRAVCLLLFMFSQSHRLSLCTLVFIPFIIILPEWVAQFYQGLTAEVQTSLAKANDVATETLSAMRTVRSFANEAGECERYEQRLQDTYHLNKKEAALYAICAWTSSLSGLLLKVCVLCYGGLLVAEGNVTSGGLVSFILYQMQFTSAVEALLRFYPQVKKAVGASEKVFEYMDLQPTLALQGTLAPATLGAHIQFHNVTFAYPNQPDVAVLKDVSFEVRAGEVTALVGPSGGGKTTCVNLLQRFYEPQSGHILLDGRLIEEYEHKYYHSKVVLVSQEPELFDRSVEDNIAYSVGAACSPAIVLAARSAAAHGFITELKDRYSTDVGQKGGDLSGGQKQRVAIARALIRHPRVLILDDPTSSLDDGTAHLVHESMFARDRDRAVLVITHRQSTMEWADRVVVLEKGAVVEQGPRLELEARGGRYHRLLHAQGTESGPPVAAETDN
ncbi:antigen peptide transporter 1-like [Amblyraja radiata]|uniref:antigen peptide transporter 1-like n=1 Tax=Amblyraja radiata TaxID=386614 RepID=UPI0014025DC3|nr:antigen peptide transporter 1-like [Amblyraja radiata]